MALSTKKVRLSKNKSSITKGQLWRARQKQQASERYISMRGRHGFLVITNRGKEMQGTNEVLSWLDDQPDEAKKSEREDEEEEIDLQKLVEKEVEIAQQERQKRRMFDVGLDCLQLVKTETDPLVLIQRLVHEITTNPDSSLIHVDKIIPFQVITHPTFDAISLGVKHLLMHFLSQQPTPGDSFALALRFRGGDGGFSRDELLSKLADVCITCRGGSEPWKVNLTSPSVVIGVEVVRGIAGLFVTQGEEYRQFKKFHIRGLIAGEDEGL